MMDVFAFVCALIAGVAMVGIIIMTPRPSGDGRPVMTRVEQPVPGLYMKHKPGPILQCPACKKMFEENHKPGGN